MKDKNKQSDYEQMNLEELISEANSIIDYLENHANIENEKELKKFHSNQRSKRLTIQWNDLYRIGDHIALRPLVADGHRIGLSFLKNKGSEGMPNQFTVSLLPLVQGYLDQTLFMFDFVIHFPRSIGGWHEGNKDFMQSLIGSIEWKVSRPHAFPPILIMKIR